MGLATVGFFLLGLPNQAAALTAEVEDTALPCHRVALEQSPSFSYSAAWSVDGRLFVAGPLEGKVFVYDDTGRYMEFIANPGLGPYEFTRPHVVQSFSNGDLVIHESGNHSIWLNNEFQGTRSVRLSAEQFPRLEHVSAVGRIWNGTHLVSRAYLKLDGEDKTGFARFSLGESPEFLDLAVAFSEDPMDVEARYQRMAGPSTAISDGKIYGLVFGNPSQLYRLSPTVQALEVFPAGYEKLTPLPNTPGNALGTALRLKFVQRQSIPVALYGHGAYLYLLTRDPLRTEDGYKTTWRLHQIDPEADELVRSLTLPTQTEHLLLAPGSQQWALIEKGPVNEVAQHEIKSMVLVPTPWVEDPTNPALREDGDGPVCN